VAELLATDTHQVEDGIQYTESLRYLREAYDENFRLETGPTGVEMCDSEHATRGSLFEYWMGKFVQFQIATLFNISLNEYLDQPRFRIQAMNRIAEQDSHSEVATANRLASQLGKK
jgi:hypothetical protein